MKVLGFRQILTISAGCSAGRWAGWCMIAILTASPINLYLCRLTFGYHHPAISGHSRSFCHISSNLDGFISCCDDTFIKIPPASKAKQKTQRMITSQNCFLLLFCAAYLPDEDSTPQTHKQTEEYKWLLNIFYLFNIKAKIGWKILWFDETSNLYTA